MPELEKITINLSVVDLGKIDLLVDEGFYSNRTDFIRSAIRGQINSHASSIEQTVVRKAFVLGVLVYSKENLETRKKAGEKLDIRTIGMLVIEDDVTPELVLETINSVKIYGVVKANNPVKKVMLERIIRA